MLSRSLALALVCALNVLPGCKGESQDGPAPEWLVKVTGVTPESVEARRLERQAAFERGERPAPPDPFYHELATRLGIVDDVRAARLGAGLDPDTGQRIDVASAH